MAPKCASGGRLYGGAVTDDGIVDARRATVVAFYGGLPGALDELVARLQARAAAHLGSIFEARPRAQVHATVIGLETAPAPAGPDRSRFDAAPLLAHLVATFAEHPLDIQFGGAAREDGRWPSRGASRYERSFLCGPAGVVLIGWPVGPAGDETVPLPTLATIRRGCEPFGARHRYHVEPGSEDPDAYLVIGRLTAPPGPAAADLADAVRSELAAAPVRVRLGPEQLSLVEYTDTALPVASSRRRPLVGF
jgi:hypothetical protein